MNKLFNNIKASAMVEIGSRVYGGETPESDYDFVMTTAQCETMLKYLDNTNIDYKSNAGASDKDAPGDYKMYNTHNIKFMVPGMVQGETIMINLLGYTPEDIPKMMLVNDMMLEVMKTPLGSNIKKDKLYRIDMFQAIIKNVFSEYEPEELYFDEIDTGKLPF